MKDDVVERIARAMNYRKSDRADKLTGYWVLYKGGKPIAKERNGDIADEMVRRLNAQAALKAIEDAGLVIVPREPTEAMLEAGDDADSEAGYETFARGVYGTNAKRIYTAMIEAATIGE